MRGRITRELMLMHFANRSLCVCAAAASRLLLPSGVERWTKPLVLRRLHNVFTSATEYLVKDPVNCERVRPAEMYFVTVLKSSFQASVL